MKDKLFYAAVIFVLITPFLLFFLISWYYALIIGNIIYSILCSYYIRISNKEYSTIKSIIIPLIFNFLGFYYIVLKINKAKDKGPNGLDADSIISYVERKVIEAKADKKVDKKFPTAKDLLDNFRKKLSQDTDPEKYLKFKKFKENVKNILNTNENIFITIYPYKYDTIEKQETYGDLYWEGIKYTASWDMFVKNAVFKYVDYEGNGSVSSLSRKGLEEFYETIKKYESLDALLGYDFNLVPDGDSGAHRENIKIEWERPLSAEEFKEFEEYGGVEELASDTIDYDNEDVIVGRISSIEIIIGKESFKIEIL